MDAPDLACLAPQWLAALYPVCSHDLPNQLVALHSLLHLLEMDCSANLTDDGKEYVRRLHGVAAKIGELSDFLKEIVRLPKTEPARERVPLAAILRELKARAAAASLEIAAWEVEAGSEPVIGDARLLVQALAGLCALLVESAGGADLRARLASRRTDRSLTLELSVHRPGAGPLSPTSQNGPAFLLAAARLALMGGQLAVLPAEPGRIGIAVVMSAGVP